MKEDNRRSVMLLEQMSNSHGDAVQANALLLTKWEKLKVEAGKPDNWDYEADGIKAEVLGDNAKLKAQVNELDNQVDSSVNHLQWSASVRNPLYTDSSGADASA